jgi:hypothetical protein
MDRALGLCVGNRFHTLHHVIPEAAAEPFDQGDDLSRGVPLAQVGKPVVLGLGQSAESQHDPPDTDDASRPRAPLELKLHELRQMAFVA